MKALPFFEIGIGLLVLSSFRSRDMAVIVSIIYIFFSIIILYVSNGFFFQPIDCGCFGESGHDWPVYILLFRNITIASLLICFRFIIKDEGYLNNAEVFIKV